MEGILLLSQEALVALRGDVCDRAEERLRPLTRERPVKMGSGDHRALTLLRAGGSGY